MLNGISSSEDVKKQINYKLPDDLAKSRIFSSLISKLKTIWPVWVVVDLTHPDVARFLYFVKPDPSLWSKLNPCDRHNFNNRI